MDSVQIFGRQFLLSLLGYGLIAKWAELFRLGYGWFTDIKKTDGDSLPPEKRTPVVAGP